MLPGLEAQLEILPGSRISGLSQPAHGTQPTPAASRRHQRQYERWRGAAGLGWRAGLGFCSHCVWSSCELAGLQSLSAALASKLLCHLQLQVRVCDSPPYTPCFCLCCCNCNWCSVACSCDRCSVTCSCNCNCAFVKVYLACLIAVSSLAEASGLVISRAPLSRMTSCLLSNTALPKVLQYDALHAQ